MSRFESKYYRLWIVKKINIGMKIMDIALGKKLMTFHFWMKVCILISWKLLGYVPSHIWVAFSTSSSLENCCALSDSFMEGTISVAQLQKFFGSNQPINSIFEQPRNFTRLKEILWRYLCFALVILLSAVIRLCVNFILIHSSHLDQFLLSLWNCH